jgi:hypothetical protein
VWGRLSSCGGLVTRQEALRTARRRWFTTGAQDAILPHILRGVVESGSHKA